jgi:predicted secreted protein
MRMLALESSVLVDGITGSEITELLLNPSDARYRAWWPGTHLRFHVVASARGHVGDVVWIDEYIGSRRVRMSAVVVEAQPGRQITWQFKRGLRLPGWLRLQLDDRPDGCLVRHRVEVGYRCAGRFLDPVLRLYLSTRFAAALDEHVHTEFPLLRDYLHGTSAARSTGERRGPRGRFGPPAGVGATGTVTHLDHCGTEGHGTASVARTTAADPRARSPRRRWVASDERSGRVAFVSHCLLNQNVRYPGGATCAGAVPEVLGRYVDDGVGLCQMPCPEQRAWGGVPKRHLLRLCGRRPLRWRTLRRTMLAVVTGWTRLVYRRLARRVADDIADYIRSGLEVVEIVGVGGSPSCGVHTTLDLERALAALARVDPATDRRSANRRVVTDNVVPGTGVFIACLDRALAAHGVRVAHSEHDLVAELTQAGAVAP